MKRINLLDVRRLTAGCKSANYNECSATGGTEFPGRNTDTACQVKEIQAAEFSSKSGITFLHIPSELVAGQPSSLGGRLRSSSGQELQVERLGILDPTPDKFQLTNRCRNHSLSCVCGDTSV